MRPERYLVTDRIWKLVEPLLPGTHRSRGVTGRDNRLFLEAVLWKVRVGGQWRDLSPGFGNWNSLANFVGGYTGFQLRGCMEYRCDNHCTTLNVHSP